MINFKMYTFRNVSSGVKEFYERVVVLTFVYRLETWGMREQE